MNISRGYVRLFRQIDEWEWYDNPFVKAIFIHCLLKANDKAKDWRDLKIKRGQFVTSLEKLATANGLTVRQTRTALKNLQMTQEIDIQTTSRYSIITVKNYNLYQASDKVKRQANDIQTSCKTTTTNNNIDIYSNNINTHTIEKNNVCVLPKISKADREILKNYARKSKATNISAYVHTLIANGGYLEILEQEKAKAVKKKQKEIATAAEKIENIQETPEEREKIAQVLKKTKANLLEKIRKGD